MRIGIQTAVILTFILLLSSCNHLKVDLEPPYQTGNNPLNIRQFGFVAQDNEWLYYIDAQNNHNISRTDGDVKETYDNTYARGLNLDGDYIYFASHSSDFEGSSGLYRVSIDNPQDVEKIHKHHTNSPIIINDYIFYTIQDDNRENNGLYRSKVDGTEQVQLVEGMINALQWADGWLYYAIPSGAKVLKIKPDGDDKTEITTDNEVKISATNFLVFDDWIYFENEDRLFNSRFGDQSTFNIYRMKLDGSKLQDLAEGKLETYDETSNYIYFSSEKFDGGDTLYSMNPDGSNKVQLYQGDKEWNWINIAEDCLYLLDWTPEEQTFLYHLERGDGELKQFDE